MKQPVTTLKTGEEGIVSHFSDVQMAGKFVSMGVLPGSSVRVVRIAPFNGGYYLRVDDTNLVLRTEEAHSIILNSLSA